MPYTVFCGIITTYTLYLCETWLQLPNRAELPKLWTQNICREYKLTIDRFLSVFRRMIKRCKTTQPSLNNHNVIASYSTLLKVISSNISCCCVRAVSEDIAMYFQIHHWFPCYRTKAIFIFFIWTFDKFHRHIYPGDEWMRATLSMVITRSLPCTVTRFDIFRLPIPASL